MRVRLLGGGGGGRGGSLINEAPGGTCFSCFLVWNVCFAVDRTCMTVGRWKYSWGRCKPPAGPKQSPGKCRGEEAPRNSKKIASYSA